MIERLTLTLRSLAALPGDHRAEGASAASTMNLAADFDDAYLLFAQCQQLDVTAGQRGALRTVDRLLDEMRRPDHQSLWSPEALRQAPEWSAVRDAAMRALRELGHAVEAPVNTDD